MNDVGLSWSQWVRSGEWRESIPTAMPVLPALAAEVIALAADPDVTVSQLSRLVSKEPVIAARVLHLANAAYYAPLQDVTTINGAIIRMGTSAIRNVVVTACLASRGVDPTTYGAHGRSLLDHAIGTAYMARLVAEPAGVPPEEAFLAGLLHDIGKLLLLKLAHDYEQWTGSHIAPDEVDEVVAERHAAIGAEVLRAWRLPPILDEPVMYHHVPEAARTCVREVEVVYLANCLSHRYGFGCPVDEEIDLERDIVAARIPLTPEWLSQTDHHAPGLFAVARHILS